MRYSHVILKPWASGFEWINENADHCSPLSLETFLYPLSLSQDHIPESYCLLVHIYSSGMIESTQVKTSRWKQSKRRSNIGQENHPVWETSSSSLNKKHLLNCVPGTTLILLFKVLQIAGHNSWQLYSLESWLTVSYMMIGKQTSICFFFDVFQIR